MFRPVVSNKLLEERWQRKQRKKHKERLAKVSPTVDNKEPRRFSHLESRKKRDLLEKEMYDRIEKDNLMLLEKMHRINHRRPELTGPKGRPHSLNAPYRKRELQRIMDENQRILERIQGCKPFYSKKKFAQHSAQHQQYRRSIAERKTRSPRRKRGGNKQKQLTRKGRSGAAKHQDKGGAAGTSAVENILLKKSLKIGGDRFVIATVIENMHPHMFSIRTYDLDTNEAHHVEVTFTDVERMVLRDLHGSGLLDQHRREDLADVLCAHLSFDPDLKLARKLTQDTKIQHISKAATAGT